MRISLIATKDLTCAGLDYLAGDHFEASPVQAAALTYQRKARFARKLEARIIAEKIESEDLDTEQPRKKRRYRRRDMQAAE